MTASESIIAVFGATGSQGGGVVRALRNQGRFRVRAITRDPASAEGLADEVVGADLSDPATLAPALSGAYGVFLVTNAWAGPDVDEIAQGRAAVAAAKEESVSHFVWSTLPDVETISSGAFDVPHFTHKARVDAVVSDAGFDFHTFVEAPFYYQNLTGGMKPQPQDDGSSVLAVPIDPHARGVHMGDAAQLGSVVAGALANRDEVGHGEHLSLAGDLMSFEDVAHTLREQGHRVSARHVPPGSFDGLFPGAREIREMMQYFEAHTYFGPDADAKIERARAVATEPATPFSEWARTHVRA